MLAKRYGKGRYVLTYVQADISNLQHFKISFYENSLILKYTNDKFHKTLVSKPSSLLLV